MDNLVDSFNNGKDRELEMASERPLKYGINPHQGSARLTSPMDDFPFAVRNGEPGYINMMDALNAWQLVKELKSSLGLPAAASFKHVSPAGAAIGAPLTAEDKAALFLPGQTDPSPLASALLRARGADPVSSFGDFIALSDPVDAETAGFLAKEVSDGIIAPGYDGDALKILCAKKQGRYVVLEVDPAYEPSSIERREIFGVTFEQQRNDARIDSSLLGDPVTKSKNFPRDAIRNAVVALIALKYTQSNSVAFAASGQAVGIGAGQQSRIHCTRIAADKAETWLLRRHPAFAKAPFSEDVSRTERYNAIDQCVHFDQLTEPEKRGLAGAFTADPPRVDAANRTEWFGRYRDIVYVSDAFIPFRDNIDRAAALGARYVVQPGGSVRDDDVIKAADEYGMTMAFTGLRLFTH